MTATEPPVNLLDPLFDVLRCKYPGIEERLGPNFFHTSQAAYSSPAESPPIILDRQNYPLNISSSSPPAPTNPVVTTSYPDPRNEVIVQSNETQQRSSSISPPVLQAAATTPKMEQRLLPKQRATRPPPKLQGPFHSRVISSPASLPPTPRVSGSPPGLLHQDRGPASRLGYLRHASVDVSGCGGAGPVLPVGWEMAKTADGQVYYMNHVTKTTQWEDPTLTLEDKKKKEGLQHCRSSSFDRTNDLPSGWEQARTAAGEVYFINHIKKTTSWADPRKQPRFQKGISAESRAISKYSHATQNKVSTAARSKSQESLLQDMMKNHSISGTPPRCGELYHLQRQQQQQQQNTLGSTTAAVDKKCSAVPEMPMVDPAVSNPSLVSSSEQLMSDWPVADLMGDDVDLLHYLGGSAI